MTQWKPHLPTLLDLDLRGERRGLWPHRWRGGGRACRGGDGGRNSGRGRGGGIVGGREEGRRQEMDGAVALEKERRGGEGQTEGVEADADLSCEVHGI